MPVANTGAKAAWLEPAALGAGQAWRKAATERAFFPYFQRTQSLALHLI